MNGNARVTIYADGTREIEYPDSGLKLDYPLNIDIRLSEACEFGMNQKTGRAICDFCHESATTDGARADIKELIAKLTGLPAGTELAVGFNAITENEMQFAEIANSNGWIVNATINQGLIHKYKSQANDLINRDIINGVGISFRSGMKDIPREFIEYENTVVHVIAGIDNLDDILQLSLSGVRKILVLGEKDFGFNKGMVQIKSENHIKWYRQFHRLFDLFEVVSFDNLALDQLKVKRFVKDWETVYQHEYSFYINAVQKYFAPSSRSDDIIDWNETSVRDYFHTII